MSKFIGRFDLLTVIQSRLFIAKVKFAYSKNIANNIKTKI